MANSAYVLKQLDKAFGESKRLSAQALAFLELEMPEMLKMIPAQARLADFGCGTGVISSALAAQLPQSEVIGLDPDERALELAQEQGSGIKNLRFERYGFGEEAPPPSAPFDVAFTRLVLLHMPDPRRALRQMARSLKPGGLLYLVDCDDDYVDFLPREPWQLELLEIMREAQALRGGTRRLGSRLLGMLSEEGIWPGGARVVYYSSDALGMPRWKEIFAPALGNMAARDLKFLAERGRLSAAKHDALARHIEEFCARPGARAQLSAWHAWGHRL